MFQQPEILHALLSHLTDALITYVCYQIDAGAQVVQLFDSWAHHLSPDQFGEFSLPYAEQVIKGVKKIHPDVPIIFHMNGGRGAFPSQLVLDFVLLLDHILPQHQFFLPL